MANQLPIHLNLVAGALAGIVELCMMYPLDVIKTRAQQVGAARISIWNSLRSLVQEGGVPRLYRGILPPLMIEPLKRAVKFTSNAEFTKLIVPKGTKKTTQQAALSGSCTGLVESCVIAPFEIVKVRLQVPNRLGQYANTFDCAKKMLHQEGFASFSIGLSSAMQRNAVWNSVYFGMIECIHQNRPNQASPMTLRDFFVAGFISGILATTCNTPWDVICSRVRNNPESYKYTYPSMAHIARTEGLQALWKGYAVKVMRLGPGGGIMLLAYEFFKKMLLPYAQ